MKEDELKRLMQDSGMSVRSDFSSSVMKQIDRSEQARSKTVGSHAVLLTGLVGLLLLILAPFFAVDIVFERVASILPVNSEYLDSALRLPVLISMSLFSIVVCSQFFKMYKAN